MLHWAPCLKQVKTILKKISWKFYSEVKLTHHKIHLKWVLVNVYSVHLSPQSSFVLFLKQDRNFRNSRLEALSPSGGETLRFGPTTILMRQVVLILVEKDCSNLLSSQGVLFFFFPRSESEVLLYEFTLQTPGGHAPAKPRRVSHTGRRSQLRQAGSVRAAGGGVTMAPDPWWAPGAGGSVLRDLGGGPVSSERASCLALRLEACPGEE